MKKRGLLIFITLISLVFAVSIVSVSGQTNCCLSNLDLCNGYDLVTNIETCCAGDEYCEDPNNNLWYQGVTCADQSVGNQCDYGCCVYSCETPITKAECDRRGPSEGFYTFQEGTAKYSCNVPQCDIGCCIQTYANGIDCKESMRQNACIRSNESDLINSVSFLKGACPATCPTAIETGIITGNVRDTNNNPIQNAKITAGGRTTFTDNQGIYSFNVIVGTHDIVASKNSYVSQTKENQAVSKDAITTVNFQLTPTNTGFVLGKVTETSGAPLQEVLIVANGIPRTSTDSNGDYTIELPPGTYTMQAKKSGYLTATTEKTVTATETITADFILTTTATGIVTGIVKDEQGNTLSGVTIEAVGTTIKATTDLSGQYNLENVPTGVKQISASLTGYQPKINSTNVIEGTTKLDFVLPFIITNEAGYCTDGVDNDGDGLIDCNDEDCTTDKACQMFLNEMKCYDNIDNDLDGLKDCDDPDCINPENPAQVDQRCSFSEGTTTTANCNWARYKGTELYCCEQGAKDCDTDGIKETCGICISEICNDGIDNDNDGLKDCADPDCNKEVCNAEIDTATNLPKSGAKCKWAINDDNTEYRCCAKAQNCGGNSLFKETCGNCAIVKENCYDNANKDEDEDGCPNLFDSECGGKETGKAGWQAIIAQCSDFDNIGNAIDNDCDSLFNGADPDCFSSISGKTYLESGALVGGIVVRAYQNGVVKGSAISGTDGFYEIKNLRPDQGNYTLKASEDLNDLYETATIEKANVKATKETTGQDFYLKSAATGYIYGRVDDKYTNQGIDGVSITAINKDKELSFTITTSGGGSYDIQKIPIGNYKVIAYKQGYYLGAEDNVQVFLNTGTQVNFEIGSVDCTIERPKPRDLKVEVTKGVKELKLSWNPPICSANGYKIYRCQENNCITIDSTDTNFTDTSVEWIPEDAIPYALYFYNVSAIYDNLESEHLGPVIASPGNKKCEGIFDTAEFCVYNAITGNSSRYYCNNLNIYTKIENCEAPLVCTSSGTKTECRKRDPCGEQTSYLKPDEVSYYTANPFGLFYTPDSCTANSRYCYYDSSNTSVDYCFNCSPKMDCYSFRSQPACELYSEQNCGIKNCLWFNTAKSPVGIGLCIQNSTDYCWHCDDTRNDVFDICNREKCTALGLNRGCYFKEKTINCISCADATCYDFETPQDCDESLIATKLDPLTNKLIPGSDNYCKINVCRWKGDKGCIKDANADNNDDCPTNLYNQDKLKECRKDMIAPKTEITGYNAIMNPRLNDITLRVHVNNIGVGGTDIKNTYFCIDNESKCTNYDEVQNNKINLTSTGTIYTPGTTVQYVLKEGINYVRFYSEDKSHNLELVKNISFILDSTPPEITITLIKKPLTTYDSAGLPNGGYTNVTVYIATNEPSTCTVDLDYQVIAGKESSKITSKQFNQPELTRILNISYVADGYNTITAECTDNMENEATATKDFVTDADPRLKKMAPPEIINTTTLDIAVNSTGYSTVCRFKEGTNSNDLANIHFFDMPDSNKMITTMGNDQSVLIHNATITKQVGNTYYYKVSCPFANTYSEEYIKFTIDQSPPAVEAQYPFPSQTQFDFDKWYQNNVEIYFNCEDQPENGFGCANVTYCKSITGTQCDPNTEFDFAEEQSTNFIELKRTLLLCYKAKENIINEMGGLESASECHLLKIDKEPPAVIVDNPRDAIVSPATATSIISGKVVDYGAKVPSLDISNDKKNINDLDYANFNYYLNVNITEGNLVQIIFREINETNYYAAVVNRYANQINLIKVAGGSVLPLAAPAAKTIDLNKVYSVHIKANNNNLFFDFDGATITTTDDSYAYGKLGVKAFDTTARFTNILIQDLIKPVSNNYSIEVTNSSDIITQTITGTTNQQNEFSETIALDYGPNTIEIKGYDIAGNPSNETTIHIYRDNEGPQSELITIYSNPEWEQVSGVAEYGHALLFKINISDIDWTALSWENNSLLVEIKNISALPTGISFAQNLTPVKEDMYGTIFNATIQNKSMYKGNYSLTLYMKDKFSNLKTFSQTFEIDDTTAPQFNITIENNIKRVTWDKNYTVQVIATEPVHDMSISYKLKGTNIIRQIQTIPVDALNTTWRGTLRIAREAAFTDIEKEAEFSIYALDINDIRGDNITKGKNFTIDTRGPKLEFIFPSEQPYYTKSDKIKISGYTALNTSGDTIRTALNNNSHSIREEAIEDIENWAQNQETNSAVNPVYLDEASIFKNASIGDSEIYIEGIPEKFVANKFLEFSNHKIKTHDFYKIISAQKIGSDATILQIIPSLKADLTKQDKAILYNYSAPQGWFSFNFNLAETSNWVYIQGVDKLGNTGKNEYAQVIHDKTKPVASEFSPASGTITATNTTNISVSVTDDNSGINSMVLKVYKDNAPLDTTNKIILLPNKIIYVPENNELEIGKYKVNLNAEDNAGNILNTTGNFEISDNVPKEPLFKIYNGVYAKPLNNLEKWYTSSYNPLINLEFPEQALINITFLELITKTQPLDVYKTRINNQSFNVSFSMPITGEHTLEIKAIKKLTDGWTDEGQWRKNFEIDTTNPVITLDDVPATNNQYAEATGTFNEKNIKYIEIYGDEIKTKNATITGNRFNATVEFKNQITGLKIIKAKAVDIVGHETETTTTAELDTTPPDAISFTPQQDGFWHNFTQLKLNWSSDPDVIDYSFILTKDIAEEPDQEGENLIEKTLYFNESGTWYFKIKAKDRAGNWGAANNYKIKIDKEKPDVIPIKPLNNEVVASHYQNITIKLEDALSGIKPNSIEFYLNIGAGFTKIENFVYENNIISYAPEFPLPEQKIYIKIIAEDNAGNRNNFTYSFDVDTSVPVISNARLMNLSLEPFDVNEFINLDSSYYVLELKFDKTVFINNPVLTINNDIKPIDYIEDNDNDESTHYFYLNNFNLTEGVYKLALTATGIRNNVSNNVMAQFTVDRTPPIIYPLQQSLTNKRKLTLTGNFLEENIDKFEITGALPINLTYSRNNYVLTVNLSEGDGTKNIGIKAIDKAGNKATIQKLITLDTTPPQLTAEISPDPSSFGPVNISFNSSEQLAEKSITIKIADQTINLGTDYEAVYEVTTPNSYGDVLVLINGTDDAGNTGKLKTGFTIDTKPPVLEINPENNTIAKDVEISATIIEDDLIESNISGINGTIERTGNKITLIPENLTDRNYTVIFYAKDRAGNFKEKSTAFTIDKDAPKITITKPEKTYLNQNPAVEGNVDEISNMSLYLNNQKFDLGTGTSFAEQLNLTERGNNVIIKATDIAGNKAEKSLMIVKDITSPELNMVAPSVVQGYNAYVYGNFGEENIKNITVSGDAIEKNAGIFENKYSAEITLIKIGENKVNVIAYDRAGNKANVSATIYVDTTEPTINIAEVDNAIKISDKYYKTGNDTVIVRGTYSDDENVTIYYGAEKATLIENEFSIPVALAGNLNEMNYTITLTIVDASGRTKKDSIVITKDKKAPFIEILKPKTLKTNKKQPEIRIRTDEKAACKINYTIQDISVEQNFTTLNRIEHYLTLQYQFVTESDYKIRITCIDDYGNKKIIEKSISYDTTSPVIVNFASKIGELVNETDVSKKYNIYSNPLTRLIVESNEKVNCRYSLGPPLGYEVMDEFEKPYLQAVESPLLYLENKNNYTYYIDCEDEAGNKLAQVLIVNINVNLNAPIKLINPSPQGYINTFDPTISVTTLRNATCSYKHSSWQSKVPLISFFVSNYQMRGAYYHLAELPDNIKKQLKEDIPITFEITCEPADPVDIENGVQEGKAKITFTIDATPPNITILEPLFNITNESEILIKGITEPNSHVWIDINGVPQLNRPIKTLDGNFEAKAILNNETNKVVVWAIDKAQNTNSTTLEIELTNLNPKVKEIYPVTDNSYILYKLGSLFELLLMPEKDIWNYFITGSIVKQINNVTAVLEGNFSLENSEIQLYKDNVLVDYGAKKLVNNNTIALAFDYLPDGEYKSMVIPRNNEGKEGIKQFTYFTIDSRLPFVAVTPSERSVITTIGPITFIGTLNSDTRITKADLVINSIPASIYKNNIGTIEFSVDAKLTKEGPNVIIVAAENAAKNPLIAKYIVIRDTTGPTANVTIE